MEGEEEEEPIQVEGSGVPNDQTMSLCLIGKLWTERSYNTFGLMETMKKIWNPNRGMTCSDLGSRLLSFQFNTERDMKRVLDMEPWHFNKHVLVLRRITDEVQPSTMLFDTVPFWIRIYDLPRIERDEAILNQIGGRFGDVLEIDKTTVAGITRSVRIKVRINLEKPIKRGKKIKIGTSNPIWLPVTYERLPSFCYWCGKLGQTHKDCSKIQEKEEDGEEIGESDFPYGEWLRASPLKVTRVLNTGENDDRERLRRGLFSNDKKTEELNGDNTGKEVKEGTDPKTEQQVDDLLNIFEKVEISSKSPWNDGNLDTVDPISKHSQCRTNYPNPHLPLNNNIHPKTKTTYQTLEPIIPLGTQLDTDTQTVTMNNQNTLIHPTTLPKPP